MRDDAELREWKNRVRRTARFRAVRLSLGRTVAEVAELVSLSTRTIELVEQGDNGAATSEYVMRLCAEARRLGRLDPRG